MDFKNIGTALRWLRTERQRKQREVAEVAGITPAMLSAYETGKHRPSLETTERVLGALGCDVVDLTSALHMVGQRKRDSQGLPGGTQAAHFEQRLRGILRDAFDPGDLKPEEEQILISLVPGLLQLIRYLKI